MVDAVIYAMRTWKVPPLALNKERGYPQALTPLLLLSYPCVPERLVSFTRSTFVVLPRVGLY